MKYTTNEIVFKKINSMLLKQPKIYLPQIQFVNVSVFMCTNEEENDGIFFRFFCSYLGLLFHLSSI